ncbi:hypothetical protein EII17_01640 [Clostridiales bacterium COT073_COT-073]|nr:hypothetical protein EII17_01640 [Clostridiales bacterium COT073_COT-073]
MNAELYLNKALLQLSRGMEEKAIESLLAVVENAEEDEVSKIKAYMILGEYYFLKAEYGKSKEYLTYINERSDEIEQEYDDLLADEVYEAEMLLEVMERFHWLCQ